MNKVLEILSQISDKSDKLNQYYNTANSQRKFSIVYRGQSNSGWGIIPSIFRGCNCNQFVIEHRLINEYIAKFPEFSSQPKINAIADMQHYGIPTRLIDWTTNPLVALYFACNDEKQKENDGKIFIQAKDYYTTPQQSLKFAELMCETAAYDVKYNLTPPELETSLDEYNCVQFGYLYAIKFYEIINCYGSTLISDSDYLLSNIQTHLKPTNARFIKCALESLKVMFGELAYYEDKIEENFLGFLKSCYAPYWFINAPTINPRIVAQNGLFQVSIGKSYLPYNGSGMFPIIERAGYNFSESNFILINKMDKREIIKQLDQYFNINLITLYLKDKQELVDEFKKEQNINK